MGRLSFAPSLLLQRETFVWVAEEWEPFLSLLGKVEESLGTEPSFSRERSSVAASRHLGGIAHQQRIFFHWPSADGPTKDIYGGGNKGNIFEIIIGKEIGFDVRRKLPPAPSKIQGMLCQSTPNKTKESRQVREMIPINSM